MFKFLGLFVFCILVQKGQCTCNRGWNEFDNEKCYKVLENFVTEENAATICSQLEDSNNAKLLEISSESEQQFLTDLIFNEMQIFDNVWLGARRFNESTFQWSYGSNIVYSNWENGSPSNNSNNNCSQLSSGTSKTSRVEAGHWIDVPCTKRNLVVCQAASSLNIEELQTLLFDLRKEVGKQEEEISVLQQQNGKQGEEISTLQQQNGKQEEQISVLQQQIVPIGFIYTEYPNKQSPKTIWPKLVWKDVTSEYAGKFFRALGGDSGAFGTVQSEGAPRLTAVESFETQLGSFGRSVSLPVGSASDWMLSGYNYAQGNMYKELLRYLTSGDKVRPINYAVRMWERTA